MEPEQIGELMGNSLAKVIGQLFGFRTLLTLLNAACSIVGGWIDSLAYRDAGERGLRAVLGTGLQGIAAGALLYLLQNIVFRQSIGPVTAIIVVWAAALRWADWLGALNRRKREKEDGYTYSFFIGWPRFVAPEGRNSYVWQGVLVVLVGALLFLVDHPGGVLVIIAGFSLLVRLWIIKARRREDVMDALDAEWLSTDRSGAKTDAGGADVLPQDAAVAQIASTADLVRYYSTR